MEIEDIREHHRKVKEQVERRLQEFEKVKQEDGWRWFQELTFVIMTSQSKAKKSWEAAKQLKQLDLLKKGGEAKIAEVLRNHGIQYEENKASYIVSNRRKLSQPTLEDPSSDLKLKPRIDPQELESTRNWLAENIQGIGWKGASHFLRNIGYGNGFAIISSHIIRKLDDIGVLEEQRTPDSKEEYIEIEQKMGKLSKQLEIDIKALDLVLWSTETGEVFK